MANITYYPIWYDVYCDLSSSVGSIEYDINSTDGTETYYSGTAVRRPGESSVRIRVNEIAADLLYYSFPLSEDYDPDSFMVGLSVDVAGETVGTYYFVDDWSYDRSVTSYTAGACVLSDPITGEVDARAVVMVTGIFDGTETLTLVWADGTTTTSLLCESWTAATGDFSDDFNDDFSVAAGVESCDEGVVGATTVLIDLSLFSGDSDLSAVRIGDTAEWRLVSSCPAARYTLYYVNARGGWDSLLVKGEAVRTDEITGYSYGRDYDNRMGTDRGTVNYLNEIAPTWELHSGWLLGSAGEKMHNLLESTDVWLYDMEGDEWFPVVISASECEWRNYRNAGRKLVDYTITVKLAEERLRRGGAGA